MNNKEQNKSMNYFLDKIVKTVKYFVFFILIGCNTCGKYNISNFKNNLDTFERVKNVIITSNLLENNNNNNNEIALKILKASILSKDYLVLKKIGLNNIQIFKEVIVFKFSYKSDDNYFEKKIDTKLETKTTNKTCNHFLFYSKNNYSKLQVMSYPRYAECRKNYEEINAFWTYSSQLWYCDD
jgi:hypothetical protein